MFGSGFGLFYNPSYFLFMIPAILLMVLTQAYVKRAYSKWSKVPSRNRVTGADAARRLMQSAGIYGVSIEGIAGNLTDHYDPRSKTLRLSRGVYEGTSVAALAIAAHELGHAQQDSEGYAPLKLRSALVPAVNIGSYLGWILIIAGFVLNFLALSWVGVAVFSAGAVFALLTLPVEINASSRAKQLLTNTGIIMGENETRGVNNVLNAAALTYVAALVTAVLQLLYYVTLLLGRRR